MPIPKFNGNGVLPPHDGDPTNQASGSPYYTYLHASSSVAAFEQQTRGSAQQNLSQQIVADFPTVIPDADTLAEFDQIVHPLFSRWIANLHESRTLAEWRDALLPKLLSGELRVPDAKITK